MAIKDFKVELNSLDRTIDINFTNVGSGLKESHKIVLPWMVFNKIRLYKGQVETTLAEMLDNGINHCWLSIDSVKNRIKDRVIDCVNKKDSELSIKNIDLMLKLAYTLKNTDKLDGCLNLINRSKNLVKSHDKSMLKSERYTLFMDPESMSPTLSINLELNTSDMSVYSILTEKQVELEIKEDFWCPFEVCILLC